MSINYKYECNRILKEKEIAWDSILSKLKGKTTQISLLEKTANANLKAKGSDLTMKSMFLTTKNTLWGVMLFVSYLPIIYYLYLLISFLGFNHEKQRKAGPRESVVKALNVLIFTHALSMILPIAAVAIQNPDGITEVTYEPVMQNFFAILFAFWWKSTYRTWANNGIKE